MMSVESIIYRKSKAVRIALVGAGVLIIFFSLKNTALLFQNYIALSSQIKSAEATPPVQHVKYPADAFEDVDLNKTIFTAISESAKVNDVIVKKINTPVVFKETDYLLLTEEITLEGDFIKIIRCMDQADEKLGFIKIGSLKFEREQTSKSSALVLKVYFQMIKATDYEKE